MKLFIQKWILSFFPLPPDRSAALGAEGADQRDNEDEDEDGQTDRYPQLLLHRKRERDKRKRLFRNIKKRIQIVHFCIDYSTMTGGGKEVEKSLDVNGCF